MVEPTPRRRRLGAELRRLREAKGWTQEEAAHRLGYKALSTVSKFESGTQRLRLQQLPHFFEVLGIEDPAIRAELRDLASKAAEPDWWQRYEGVVDDPLGDYLSQVEAAESLFIFAATAVPGLLQTEDYARAVTGSSRMWKTKEETDRFVAVRMEHQRTMFQRDRPLRLWAVLPEGLLRQQVGGPAVMRAQLAHLVQLAENHPNITLQVLSFGTGAHAGMDGPFLCMTFPNGGDIVRIESLRASLHLSHPETVAHYRVTSDLLKSDALSPRDSLSLLGSLLKELT